MFIYFWDRERQSTNGAGSEREGDTESETGSRLWVVSTEPDAGLKLTDHEIMTWAEVRRLTDWATQAPLITIFKYTVQWYQVHSYFATITTSYLQIFFCLAKLKLYPHLTTTPHSPLPSPWHPPFYFLLSVASSGSLIQMESHSVCPFVSGFYHSA